MADQFPALDLGECLDETKADIRECEVVTSTVTKGQIVEAVHVTGSLPKVAPCGAAGLAICGVAMQTGIVGARILVGFWGIFKVTAGTGGCTAGKWIIGAAAGTCCDGATAGQCFGRALHTMAAADTGLIQI